MTAPRLRLAGFFPGLILLLSLAALPLRATSETEDAKLMEDMGRRLVVVQKQILASEDPAEQLRLQQSLTAIMEETLDKLSPRSRPPLLVGLRLIQPLQQASGAYMKMVADYSASGHGDLTTITSREDIQARREELKRIDAANQDLINRLDHFGNDAAKLLDENKVGGAEKRDFLAGLEQGFGRQIGPVKAIRNLDTKMFATMTAALAHLDENWGKWQAVAGSPITWTDGTLETKFVALIDEITSLAERQTKAQQVLSRRL